MKTRWMTVTVYAILLAVVFGSLFVMSLAISVLYADEMERIFGSGGGFLWISVILLLLVIGTAVPILPIVWPQPSLSAVSGPRKK